MRQNIYLLPRSRRALQEIFKFSRKEWGQTQAVRYLTGLREHFKSLTERESLGLSRPWKPGSSIFKSRYERHLVFYRHRGTDIEIGLIIHGSQNFAREVESFESTLG